MGEIYNTRVTYEININTHPRVLFVTCSNKRKNNNASALNARASLRQLHTFFRHFPLKFQVNKKKSDTRRLNSGCEINACSRNSTE